MSSLVDEFILRSKSHREYRKSRSVTVNKSPFSLVPRSMSEKAVLTAECQLCKQAVRIEPLDLFPEKSRGDSGLDILAVPEVN